MCGIAGLLSQSRSELRAIVERMVASIRYRGPDDMGVWTDPSVGIGLGHARLSILDLSPEGHQPMASCTGRYVLSYNGEIYNFGELRSEFEAAGATFRGHSDTEVMLAAFDAWGIEKSVQRFVGMFALAVWDRHTHTLTLGRDRLGEKPLYYGWQGQTFLFGSELKALKAHPAFRAEIDRNALALFLRHSYIPAPYSIYQGISKLLPGCLLTLSLAGKTPHIVPFWSSKQSAEAGLARPFSGSDSEAVSSLETLLMEAIGQQMVADVPLGAFLSGGVDSSTVVALMQAQSSRPIKTFTIGFHEEGYDEATHAKAVARHLGTEHTELYVLPDEAMNVIPRLPTLYDEPFSDSSQIPTFLVSELARRHVTVSLSGDGGDELFGGYNRYFWATNIWRRIGWAPQYLRATLAAVLTALPPALWNGVFERVACLLPAGWRYANPGDKLHKLAEILAVATPEEIYLDLVSHWKHPVEVVQGTREPPTVLTDRAQWASLPDFERRMMYFDQMTYLPDDILTKVDRAAMGVSLETRVPFLNHRVVEFAWSLPLSMKIRHGQGKWLLRQILYRHVPKNLIDRPKMGFGVPIDVWLRGPLKEWAEELLDEARLQREGYLDPQPIRQKWLEHLTGRRNWSYHLWDVLMFQAWLARVGQPS